MRSLKDEELNWLKNFRAYVIGRKNCGAKINVSFLDEEMIERIIARLEKE